MDAVVPSITTPHMDPHTVSLRTQHYCCDSNSLIIIAEANIAISVQIGGAETFQSAHDLYIIALAALCYQLCRSQVVRPIL